MREDYERDQEIKADRIEQLEAENERLLDALESIAANTCCDTCQEAKLVAAKALAVAKAKGDKG